LLFDENVCENGQNDETEKDEARGLSLEAFRDVLLQLVGFHVLSFDISES